jgi:dolichol-phosphate mannosyltransferase
MKFTETLANSASEAPLKRYAKFCIVGATGVAVDMGIIYLLADPSMLGWNLTLSKVIAAETAIFNNFIWNDLWTFRGLARSGNIRAERLARLGKFNLICVAGISIVLVSFWNFLMNLRFGWTGAKD